MKPATRLLMTLSLVLAFVAAGAAQEAHPLVGSWVGYWGPMPDHQNRILVVMDWDGQRITGTINPGTENLPFRTASLDPTDWSVHIEVDATDFRGNAITYLIDGRIENLGSPNRSIVGTWRHGDTTDDFKISLQ